MNTKQKKIIFYLKTNIFIFNKDFKKKWKGFNDHYDYKGGKKWKGTDGKQYHKKKAGIETIYNKKINQKKVNVV